MNPKRKLIGLSAALAVLAVLAVSIFSLARVASASGPKYFDFEQTLKPWVSALDSENKGIAFELRSGDNGCPALLGNSYAHLKFIPSGSASAGWMGTSFQEGTGSDSVDLSFSAKNTGACRSCVPVVYVNKDAPTKGTQFKALEPLPTGAASDTNPDIGGNTTSATGNAWKTYHYASGVAGAKTIYVAIGMSGPRLPVPSYPNPTASMALDCVSLDIEPNAGK